MCPRQGSREVFDTLRGLVHKAGLRGEIRINHSGCMSQCGHGPMVVVYHDDTWYGSVRVEDAQELFESHLRDGRPVERLRYRPPGTGKQICRPGEECVPPQAPPEG